MSVDPAVLNFLSDLNSTWALDAGQAAVARAMFAERKKLLFMQMGRKRGKTTVALYCLVRWACTHPGSSVYWFAPRAKQAREIIWSSGRLQNFVPKKYIKKIRNTEMRVTYWNDSFIKLDGSDESDQYRGIDAHAAAYDEFKDFDPKFHVGFEPNTKHLDGPILVLGTPPRNDATPSEKQYFRLAEEARHRDDGFYSISPSWERPDPHWQEELVKLRGLYQMRSESDPDAWNEFLCEYGGQYIQGGPGYLIPQFKYDRHVVTEARVREICRDRMYELDFYCVADPGTNHAFAVTFWAVDTHKGMVYCWDEICETDQRYNTTRHIYPRILEAAKRIYPHLDEWNYVYDEAALWFKADVNANYEDYGWMPTNKKRMKAARDEPKPFLQTLKDALREDRMLVSDLCVNFIREMKSYARDENGSIPKRNDDCIDTARYFFAASNFSFNPAETEVESRTMPPRGFTALEPVLDDTPTYIDFNFDVF